MPRVPWAPSDRSDVRVGTPTAADSDRIGCQCQPVMGSGVLLWGGGHLQTVKAAAQSRGKKRLSSDQRQRPLALRWDAMQDWQWPVALQCWERRIGTIRY